MGNLTQHLPLRHRAKPDRTSPYFLERLTRLPYTSFNYAELLVDGAETFEAIFKAIDAAQDYILVQYYIVRDDELGRKLRDKLIARAKAGVRVYFLYDEIGSNKLPRSYIDTLKHAGVHIGPFNSTKGSKNRFQLNFRNHRKIVVVDGKSAFVGGLNVGDEYMLQGEGWKGWRDTHMKVQGPCVQLVQLSFVEDWMWATAKLPQLNWEPEKATSATETVVCLPSGPADPFETCTLFFLDTINNAKRRLWIATPYFVPDEQIMSALELAALRGVDVRILVPALNDNTFVRLCMYSFLPKCERAGIKVFRYDKCFMHQKVLVADDDISAIGTANFDNRSFRLNFEITMIVQDEAFAARMVEMLQGDMQHATPVAATELTSASLPFRIAVNVTRLAAPIL
jgi:cardiolipin synthase